MVRQPADLICPPSLQLFDPGVVIVLFFRSMGALLIPIDRTRGGIKWPLVAHTLAMFSFVTINTALSIDIQSVSSIDNREFLSVDGLPPGPIGYQFFTWQDAISLISTYPLFLNGWLADGLLVSFAFHSVSQTSN
jgi:hypothetical protein